MNLFTIELTKYRKISDSMYSFFHKILVRKSLTKVNFNGTLHPLLILEKHS